MSEGQFQPEWPGTGWRLSAPESYVVLNGPGASGSEAFKLGLTELVARGALELDRSAEQRDRLRTKRVSALRDGPRAVPSGERALDAVWALYQGAPRRAWVQGEPAVTVEDLARAAARKYGTLGRFVAHEVLPPLVERQLFEARKARVLLVFSTTRYVLTSAGETARAELEQWLATGRDRFADWVGSDTHQALAYAGAAGAALLLMPPLFPELRRLREQTQQSGVGDDDDIATASASVASITSSDVLGDGSGIDLGQLDLGGLPADLGGFDFATVSLEVFNGLEAATSAIESAVDSVGGDSGSGGDSGGSGDSSSGSSDSGGGSSDSGGGGGGDSSS